MDRGAWWAAVYGGLKEWGTAERLALTYLLKVYIKKDLRGLF